MTNNRRSTDCPTIPVSSGEAARMAQVEAEFRATATQEWASRATVFLRVNKNLAALAAALGKDAS